MSENCTNDKLGRLLHAYEIEVLDEFLTEAVEIHLLECEHCLARIQKFSSIANLMVNDSKTIEEIDLLDQQDKGMNLREVWWRKLYSPNLPVFIRPVFLLAACVILVSILLVNQVAFKTLEMGPVQEINLLQFRTNDSNIITSNNEKHITIAFTYPDYNAKMTCSVTLENENHDTVYVSADFTSFDIYKTGRLLLPISDDTYGSYRLIINNNTDTSRAAEYTFSIMRAD